MYALLVSFIVTLVTEFVLVIVTVVTSELILAMS